MKATVSEEKPEVVRSKGSPKVRNIRYSAAEQSKAAGDWAASKYRGVFRRLAQ
jgi:hypothetical protein